MKHKIAAVTILGLAAIGLSYSTLRAQESRSVWDGVYTNDQAKRGEALYKQNCAMCHGESLEGEDEAPALSGGGFLSNWAGLTVGDLFERIRTSMPFNKPQSLNRETVAAILSYILSANKFPAAGTELPSQTEVLKQIRLDAEKPDQKK
jgi:mono/diheme cytochrome c family protein